MSMKKSNDTIGNQTRDLPTCSAVPQPTALPRAPKKQQYEGELIRKPHCMAHEIPKGSE